MDVELPDGTILTGVPDGTTQEQILGRLKDASPERYQSVLSAMQKHQAETAKPDAPTLTDALFGKATFGQYLQGGVDSAKKVFDPQTYRDIASELSPAGWARTARRRSLNEGLTVGAEMASGQSRASIFPEREAEAKKGLENAFSYAAMGPVSRMSALAKQSMFPPTAQEKAKDALLKLAGDAGYSVPRSNIKQTTLTNLGERFGGKQAIEATAQIKNQPVTNRLVTKALGLSDDTPITPDVLKGIRDNAGEAYKAVSKLGPLKADGKYMSDLRAIAKDYSGASKDFPELANQSVGKLIRGLAKRNISSEGAVEMVKNLRNAGNANAKSIIPADKLLGKAQSAAADVLDDLIARNIQSGSGIKESYTAARKLIAKTYAVERALNPSTMNVSAAELAKQARKGAPLSGELKQVADFARGFPRLAREPVGSPPSGGLLEPLMYGVGGTVAAGPAGPAAAAIPIIGKPIARHFMTTVPSPPKDMTRNLIIPRALFGIKAGDY